MRRTLSAAIALVVASAAALTPPPPPPPPPGEFSRWLRVDRGDAPSVAPDFAAPLTRLAFGSCNKHDKPQPAWARIVARRPDVFVWLGDIHYADWPLFLKMRIPATAERVADLYAAQLRHPDYRRLLAAVPVLGIYDDHDYGENDGGRLYNATARSVSPHLLLDFIGDADDSPRRSRPGGGVYGVWHFGSPGSGRVVRLILLDVRTHKDPYAHEAAGDARRGDFLGPHQWAWLEGELARPSEAAVTLIGSGLQFVSVCDPWITESWSKLPASKARLLALLSAHSVPRVVFLSGDVHFGELNAATYPYIGYPLYDATSSGLTHAWEGWIKALVVDLSLMGVTRVGGDWVATRNWGEVDFDWVDADARRHSGGGEDGGAGGERGALDDARTTVTLRVLAVDDSSTRAEVTVPLSALAAGSAPDGTPIAGVAWLARAGDPAGPAMSVADAAAWVADVRSCASGPMDVGLTDACARLLASGSPPRTRWHDARYFAGHAVVVSAGVGVLLAVLAAVPLAWVFGPAVPGGRAAALAVVVAGYGALAIFIDSIH